MPSGSWTTSGNASTNPPSDFLGTTDNQPLVIKTNALANPSERVRVDTSGNVGIGTTSPQKPLDVAGSGGIQISRTELASNTNEMYFADNGQIRSMDDNHRIIFNRAGNELELREYGTIIFSPGATQGQKTAIAGIDSSGLHLGYSAIGSAFDPAAGSALIFSTARAVAGIGGRSEYVRVERLRIDSGGNVGIGTSSPRSILEVDVSAPGALGPTLTLTNTAGEVNAAAAVDMNTFSPSSSGSYNPSCRIEALDDGNYSNHIVFLSNKPGAANNGLIERMRITSAGNVSVPGDIVLTGADCAEHFDVCGSEPPDPGTVVVIDEDGALSESRNAYDKKVAGVVSGAGEYRHALVLDKRPSEKERIPVALVGKVYCKVDAEYSPIEVGDLLTTSATPGHAMKATDPEKAFGSIIGKALKPLRAGSGLIPILVALQ